MSELKTKTSFSNFHIMIILSILIICSIIFRITVFPYDLPIIQDGELYFWYANDMSLTKNFPNWGETYFPNTLWPTFLSIFFIFFSYTNFINFMELQRVVSLSLSIITAISIYFLSKKFANKNCALLGTTLFLFEPRLIENSLAGITEPLLILLVTTSVLSFLKKEIFFKYMSFGILALATLTRYEVGILIIPFIIFYLFKNQKSKQIVHLGICLTIFFIIVFSVDSIRAENTSAEAPGILDHYMAIIGFYQSNSVSESRTILNDENFNNQTFTNSKSFTIETVLENLFKYYLWLIFPIFFIFVPLGIYDFLFKNNWKKSFMMCCMFLTLIPMFYALTRDFQEMRYLYIQIPFLCVLTLPMIEYLNKKTNKRIFVFLFIFLIIITCSIFYYEKTFKDNQFEHEYFMIAKKINSTMNVSNDIFPADKYIRSAKISELNEFPVLRNSFDLFSLKVISIHEKESLEKFLEYAKDNDLEYLVIDEDGDGVEFLYSIFHNEEKYQFLENVYDSKDENYKYHVKFFKIHYDKLFI